MPKKKNMKLDFDTLSFLLKEAEKEYEHYEEQFEEYDNIEDLHALEHWEATINWLENKLRELS